MWIATREGRSVSAAEQVDVIDFRNQYRIRIGDSPCRYRRREMAGRTIHSCVSEEQILPLADRHADVFIARPDSEGPWPVDRKSVGVGQRGSARVDVGGR